MKKIRVTLALAVVVAYVGCNKPSETTMNAPATVSDEHVHENDEGAHNHSDEGHAHAAGPHDGTIADWGGGKYHVEFTVDHNLQQATVYIFGTDEKTSTAIDAASIELSISDPEMQVTLQASPQESDPPGNSSRFVGTHEKLGIVQEYAGTLTGVVDGTPYSGDFKEEAHGDHKH